MSGPATNGATATVALTLQLVAATYRTPDAASRDDLASGAFAAALAELADDTAVAVPAFEVDWAEIQASHAGLFVTHPAGIPAPPYVGFAVDGEVLGATTEALLAFYATQGLKVSETWADLPDHVAAVAEAGALLADAGRDEAARALLGTFLSPWFERYAPAVVAADASGFYGPLTEFFRSVMSEVACEAAS